MIFADKHFNREKFVQIENSENAKLKCLKFFLTCLKKNKFEISKINL